MVERARILVVDDEADILTALQAYLEASLDADVLTAPSGAAGLELLAKGPAVDVIVSDYRMPGMDGVQFLRRAWTDMPDVPRILLTAFPDMQLAIQAVNEAGVMQFLTKPVNPDQFLALVRKTLEDSRRTRHSRQALDRAAALGKQPSKPQQPG